VTHKGDKARGDMERGDKARGDKATRRGATFLRRIPFLQQIASVQVIARRNDEANAPPNDGVHHGCHAYEPLRREHPPTAKPQS